MSSPYRCHDSCRSGFRLCRNNIHHSNKAEPVFEHAIDRSPWSGPEFVPNRRLGVEFAPACARLGLCVETGGDVEGVLPRSKESLAERLPFIQSEYEVDVWIDLPEEQARHSFALWRVRLEAEGDGTRLQCGRDDLRLFAAMLLSTGRRVVVRQPAELRGTFQELAREAAASAEIA